MVMYSDFQKLLYTTNFVGDDGIGIQNQDLSTVTGELNQRADISFDGDGDFQFYYYALTSLSDFNSLGYYTAADREYTQMPSGGPSLDANQLSVLSNGLSSSSWSVSFSDIANIDFVSGTTTTADIVIGTTTNGGYPSISSSTPAYALIYDGNESATDIALKHGDIWLNNDATEAWDNTSKGNYGQQIIIHEFLHALGVDIFADTNNIGTDIDSNKYTTTSYNLLNGMNPSGADDDVLPFGLQLLDIAAIQEIYGRNYDTRSDDTTYSEMTAFSSTRPNDAFIYTIWDGDGYDEIDASDYADFVKIDLRQGEFSSIGKSADSTFTSDRDGDSTNETGLAEDNVAIAYHTVIENATGTNDTSKGDILIGNSWDNVLRGLDGNDKLYGDGVVYDGETGFIEEDDDDYDDPNAYVPDVDYDELHGGAGDDELYAGSGDDRLFGGEGDDLLDGGLGADEANYVDDYDDGGTSGITVNAGLGQVVDGFGDTDTLVDIEEIEGTFLDDTFNMDTPDMGWRILDGYSGSNDEISYDTADIVVDFNPGRLGGSAYYWGLAPDVAVWSDDGRFMDQVESFDDLDFPSGTTALLDVGNAHSYVSADAFAYDYSHATTGGTFTFTHNQQLITQLGQLYITNREIDVTADIGAITHSGFLAVDSGLISPTSILSSTQTELFFTGTNHGDTVTIDKDSSAGGATILRVSFDAGTGDDTITIDDTLGTSKIKIEYRGGDDVIEGASSLERLTINGEIDLADVTIGTPVINGATYSLTLDAGAFGEIILEDLNTSGGGPDIVFESGGSIVITDSSNIAKSGSTTGGEHEGSWGDDTWAATDGIDKTFHALGGDDTMTGGTGNDTLYGGAGDDTYILGQGGQDVIEDYQGSNTLNFAGLSGADVIYKQEAGDLVIYDTSMNKMVTVKDYVSFDNEIADLNNFNISFGASGTYDLDDVAERLISSNGDDFTFLSVFPFSAYFDGGDGDDSIYSTTYDDTLKGGDGSDSFIVKGGSNDIDGGSETDTVGYRDSTSGINANLTTGATSDNGLGGSDTLANIEYVWGSDHNDTITGNGAYNVLYGYDGDDTLIGMSNNDFLLGYGGIDTASYADDPSGVVVNFSSGTVTYDEENALSIGSNRALDGFGFNDSFYQIESVIGSAHDDIFISHPTIDNDFDGGAGEDTVSFAAATNAIEANLNNGGVDEDQDGTLDEDTLTNIENLVGSDHDDTLRGDANANKLWGGDGADEIRAGSGADTIYGEDGDDNVYAQNDNDTVYGGSGDDILRGENGDDTLYGGDDDDDLYGGSGADTLYGDAGLDVLEGNDGNDIIYGGDGIDTLRGHNDNDTLYGEGGNDNLVGGNGDDILYGGDGNDKLWGEAGADTFQMITQATTFNGNVDWIMDFSLTDNDVIEFQDVLDGFVEGTSDITDFVQMVDGGSFTALRVDRDGNTSTHSDEFVIRVQGLSMTDFNNAGIYDAGDLKTAGNLIVTEGV